MGSPPCENNDTPLEERAEIDKGNAIHEDEAHVQEEAGKTPDEEETDPENDAEQEQIRGVDDGIKSEAVEIEVGEAAEQVLFPLLGLLGLITAISPRVI